MAVLIDGRNVQISDRIAGMVREVVDNRVVIDSIPRGRLRIDFGSTHLKTEASQIFDRRDLEGAA